jgi:hypothetical protein
MEGELCDGRTHGRGPRSELAEIQVEYVRQPLSGRWVIVAFAFARTFLSGRGPQLLASRVSDVRLRALSLF